MTKKKWENCPSKNSSAKGEKYKIYELKKITYIFQKYYPEKKFNTQYPYV